MLKLTAPLALAGLIGPAAFLASTHGARDPADIYIVAGAPLPPEWTAYDISPHAAPFGRMLHLPPRLHDRLINSAHWVIPAGALAQICGATATT